MKKHNFSAGPSILPQSVLQKASEAVIDFNQSGLSLIEISHRSSAFVDVMESARALSLELLTSKQRLSGSFSARWSQFTIHHGCL